MNLWQWLCSYLPSRVPINWATSVRVDKESIHVVRANGLATSFQITEINRIAIRTTDQGPFVEDVFFVLATSFESYWIPQEATGCSVLLETLQRLPGFDNGAVIAAMRCTDNREFE